MFHLFNRSGGHLRVICISSLIQFQSDAPSITPTLEIPCSHKYWSLPINSLHTHTHAQISASPCLLSKCTAHPLVIWRGQAYGLLLKITHVPPNDLLLCCSFYSLQLPGCKGVAGASQTVFISTGVGQRAALWTPVGSWEDWADEKGQPRF